MYKITLIPGVGIGPEVTAAMKKVVAKAGVEIDWEEVKAGMEVIDEYNTPLPDYVIDSIKKNKIDRCRSNKSWWKIKLHKKDN